MEPRHAWLLKYRFSKWKAFNITFSRNKVTLPFVKGKLHERLHGLSALLTISAPVLRQRVSTLTCTTIVNHINILEAKITSCVFGVPWKRSKHSKYMMTLNLPRITNYGRQVYLLPSCENFELILRKYENNRINKWF